MRRITLIFAILFAVVLSISAEHDSKKPKANASRCILSGVVTDKLTGEPLTGVEVKIINSDIKLYTDFDGKFEMKDIEAGPHSIMINLISYKGLVENVNTESGNTTKLLIKMNSVEK